MCTVVLLFRPSTEWPVLLGANRDEMLARPWAPPAAHWPDLPGVTGGLDKEGGGTWLAVDEHAGRVAAVLNRRGSLGPAAGKRSRGELPLLALRQDLAGMDAASYRPFNLVVADRAGAWFLRGLGTGPVEARVLPPGLTMITAGEPDDAGDPRIARHRQQFAVAAAPVPPDWGKWPALLADAEGALAARLFIPDTGGFGTCSTQLVGIGPRVESLFRSAANLQGDAR